jgi:hypothetical protein
VSSPKRKVKSSVNQQIKAGLSAMRDFLAGRSSDEKVVVPKDKATRELVAAELLAAMSGRSTDEPATRAQNSPSDTQEIPRSDFGSGLVQNTNEPSDRQESAKPDAPASPIVEDQVQSLTEQEQERARRLFLDHGYFDEAVQNLRGASSPTERAAAARALGVVGSKRATAHLIAAMFDDDADVRNAAAAALIQVGEPAASNFSAAAIAADEIKKVAETPPADSVTAQSDLPAQPIAAAHTNVEVPNDSPEAVELATAPVVSAPTENLQQVAYAPDISSDLIAVDSAASEEDPLHREAQTILETVANIEQEQIAAATAFKEMENEVSWRTERETKVRAEAASRRLEEEEVRKRTEGESEARRRQELEAMAIERAARLKAEAEAQRYADEETNLRMKVASLRLEAAEIARRRAEVEKARQEAAEAARQAEVMRARDEARSRHETELALLASEKETLQTATDEVLQQQTKVRAGREQAASELERLKEEQAAAEAAQKAEAERLRQEAQKANSEAQEQLRQELENLGHTGEEVDRRRKEVEASREKADEEAQRLVEAQARMQSAEQARAQAEMERSQLEAQINQQVEAQHKLLEETRRRGEEEQARLKEELRLHAEKEQHRAAELEVMRTRAAVESKALAEKEEQILTQIESLRITDADTRRRIEDAEVRRRAADDAYRLIAEKVQRVEAESHARTKEEERMRLKLEAERRNAAIEAQSRAEQEKRIREEIEMFRRLEEEERPRIEEATLQLADAEARLQERKDRLRQEVEDRAVTEEEFITVGEYQASVAERPATPDVNERFAPVSSEEATRPIARSGSAGAAADEVDDTNTGDDIAASVVTPAIATYLNSVDPYKRAAAVAELARSGSPDAFSRIVVCFDDHSSHVRNAAARALRKLEPDRTVDLFNRALEEASADRRRNIGAAIAASGLATDAINNLASESREDTYNALSILFVMAKTGEVSPLLQAVEEHRDDEIGKAVSKLLTLSGHTGTQTSQV